MPTQLLIIGLDSAEPLLVNKWASSGELPTLAKIQQQGHEVAIENYPGFGNGVYWPSINTGVDPSFHGRYYRSQVMAPDYAVRPFLEDHDMKAPPFWAALEASGYQVAVIDPVETGMGPLSKGIEIVRWMAHGRTGPPAGSPAGVIKKWLQQYGDDPFAGNTDATVKEGSGLDSLIEESLERIDIKTQAMRKLLDDRDWDVFFVTYADPHDIGHLAWHLHEGVEQQNNAELATEDPLKRCYQALDHSVSTLMESVGPEGQTIIVTGPGIEANVSANPLLPGILRALQGRQRHGATELIAQPGRFLAQSTVVPRGIREKVKRLRTKARSKVVAASDKPYYSVPHNDNAGAIRLSVVDREPNGVVPPGQPYDDVCAEITEEFLKITDATGKEPLVKSVIKVHDAFQGPEIDGLPDLVVIWNRNADVSEVSSPEIGTIKNPRKKTRSGDHSVRGSVMSDQPISQHRGPVLSPAEVTPIFIEAMSRLDKTRGK